MSNGLGRGLGSLIPQKQNIHPAADSGSVSATKNGVVEVNITDIIVNSLQPRKKFTDYRLDELAESIKEFGIIQPLLVHPVKDQPGKYELIAGERRFRASKKVGLEKVPVVVRSVDEQEKLEVAIIENLQREDLNPIDLAQAYQKLMDEFGLTQEDVAKKMSKSRPAIANTLRMLSLPEEIQLALIDGKITEGHAKLILSLEGEVKQMALFRKIVHVGLSVKDTGQEARRMNSPKPKKENEINYNDKDSEFLIREFFGARAKIERKGAGGKIIIEFYSDDELKEILSKIKK